MKINGTWQFNAKTNEIKLMLDQVQSDGSLFKMPIQVAIYSKSSKQPMIKTIQVTEKSNAFVISTDSEPEKIIIDPNFWVLMDGNISKK
ncbi:MAG: hypothetical protein HC811_06135 [Flammeovirgaceae bacterium]|nr:hypothetical protein [Flammeovirgaceae bacterium]